ncbi:hypothetical protein G7078_09675 [Sphingomonas sinipercae]|uniref:Uncharacterized protein n=1 Tax=Sphingomonas sinipercae TaxID=2714944 RepID=A0A6G7ZQ07_9SPHN|nr:DUF5985 family protein [Sphingomonas sinipercae]QIL03015.1 hypothetical protein G7078_09675 [Sphingomonas sinipercae]
MGELFPTVVYLLCLLTSAACAWLLGRGYARSGMRLLLWSCICFVLLAANNLVLVVDLLLLPQLDLRIVRVSFAVAAGAALIWGFVWENADE